ncbi:MAG: helix-turn-helix domain-containing protein [Agathobacter sp.]
MLLKYGNYLEDIPEGNINKTESVFVNSCGTYKLSPPAYMTTERADGRNDYQLIYIASGKGTFYFTKDEPTLLEAGKIVIYRPKAMQKYIYDGRDNPEIYWIHFTGKDAAAILEKYGIGSNQKSVPVGINPEYSHLFEKIIFELQCKRPFYAESSAMLFLELLVLFGRFHTNHVTYKKPLSFHKLDEATAYFHEHFNESIDIDSYIKSFENDLCASLFYRQFKEYTGQTPLQYILEIRLTNAKKMLETTDYSISEISASVGYENALYFSRLFHKHIGVSPKEYRKSSRSI